MKVAHLVLITLSLTVSLLARQPNVLFIAVDDLRPELSCYGKGHVVSPHIDKLAATRKLFQRAYCNVPVCGASRASLMSGVYPLINRFTRYYARADKEASGVVTLPQHFKENGYYTTSLVWAAKRYVTYSSRIRGSHLPSVDYAGFVKMARNDPDTVTESWKSLFHYLWRPTLGKVFHNPSDSQQSLSETPYRPDFPNDIHVQVEWRDYRDPENTHLHQLERPLGAAGPAWEAADVADNVYYDGKTTDLAVAKLEKLAKRKKPFFLGVGFIRPHLPFNAPKKYWDLYPTLCDLAGLEKPNHLQGHSLVPILKNAQATVNPYIFAHWQNGETVVSSRFNYTEYFDNKTGALKSRMLYDHELDPEENVNVVNRTDVKPVVQMLSEALKAHMTNRQ